MGIWFFYPVWSADRATSASESLAGLSLSCAHYAESMVLLDLSSARRKQREDPVTAKELAGLRDCLDS